MSLLNVFVYGTLKLGCRNHDRYAGTCCAILPARLWGRLYSLRGYDYPGLELPPSALLAEGTGDPLSDADLPRRWKNEDLSFAAPLEEGFGIVHGECLRFDDPAAALPVLDALESFVPQARDEGTRLPPDQEPSSYCRSLVVAETETKTGTETELLWVYHMLPPIDGVLIPKGVWYPPTA